MDRRSLGRLVRPAIFLSLVFLGTACAAHAPQDYLKNLAGSEARKANNLFVPVFCLYPFEYG